MIELIGIIGFIVLLFLYPMYINWAKSKQFGQYIRQEGPDLHNYKQGTPTAGGMVFVAAMLVLNIIVYFMTMDPIYLIVAISSVAFGFVGFLDDIVSIKMQRSLGLKAYQKLVLQFGLAFGVFLLIMLFKPHSSMIIPFNGGSFNLGLLYPVIAVLYMTGLSNAANLTDGLDGLAGGIFVVSAVLTIFAANAPTGLVYTIVIPVLAYLIFNIKPAKVFMGDTGSLALGGILSAVAVYYSAELFTIFTCFIFLIEMFSVMLQVGSYKIRGKRLFKMAPIHHHFELMGWHEERVVMMFWMVNIIAGILVLGGIK